MKISTERLASANSELTQRRKAVADEWLETQPDKDHLRISKSGLVYRKRPKGFSTTVGRLCTNLIASSVFRNQTNTQLVAWLQDKYPDYPVPRDILTKPLLESHLKVIKKALAEHGMSVNVALQNTPSKLKKALRSKAIAAGAQTSRSAVVTVSFTEDRVVIGDKTYTVSFEGRIRLAKGWFDVRKLERLLIPG
nr:hypothetical protein [uncultured Sphingorhabdus sp.]